VHREWSATGAITAGALVVMLMVMSADAALRGPWLDEFWTLELSDSRRGLAALVREGWLHDAHPPGFNLWATFLASIGVSSIPLGRLASNLPAAGLMIWTAFSLSRRMPEHTGFNAALLLLVLSLTQSMEQFVSYRSYFWQITALAMLVLVIRHVAATKVDLEPAKDPELALLAILATAASIGLHYISGLFGGVLAGVLVLSALAKGHRRWAAIVLATAAPSGLLVVGAALLQAPNWAVELDHNWTEGTDGLDALAVPFALAVGAICHNPVPLLGLWAGRAFRGGSDGLFIGLIAAALLCGLGVVLAINAVRPIMVERYLLAIPVLVCAIMAVPANRIARRPLLFCLLAVVSVAVVAEPMVRFGISPLWREGARTIAEIVAGCPTSRVYAASGWAVGPAAETRTARREDPVFERGYRSLADRYGFSFQYLGQGSTVDAAPGQCPVLVWFEHTPNDAETDLPSALDAAGLKGLQGASLSAIRSATGFVLRADRL
jgi:hypothetical protein